MADDVQDIAIYTGSEWTSLSELAAGVVDAKLPIESVDGTVVLSDSSGSFVVSTGGTERVVVRDGEHITPDSAADINNMQALTIENTVLGDSTAPAFVGASFVNRYSNGASGTIGVRQVYIGDTIYPKTEFVFVGRVGSAATQELLSVTEDHATFPQNIKTPSVSGPAGTDAFIALSGQATLKAGDGSEYVPTAANSIATKKTVDDKIWVGTTAAYNAIATKNPTTLYCLTD